MKNLAFLFLLLVLSLTSSCSKEGKKTEATFSLKMAAAFTQYNGQSVTGAMLWGRNNNGEIFAKNISIDSELELFLPNGDWEFYAVAWYGSSNSLEGHTICSYVPTVKLIGRDAQIDVNFSNSACAGNIFSSSSYKDSSTGLVIFPNLSLMECGDHLGSTLASCGSDNQGHAMSFRYVIPSFRKNPNQGFDYNFGTPLVSTCFAITSSSPIDTSSIKIPTGNGLAPFVAQVELFYSSSTCQSSDSKGVRKISFERGLEIENTDQKNFVGTGTCSSLTEALCTSLGGTWSSGCILPDDSSSFFTPQTCPAALGTFTADTTGVKKIRLGVKTTGVELCQGTRLSGTTPHRFAAGNGTLYRPYAICTETQLNSIGSDSNLMTGHFSLQSNLDMNKTSVLGALAPPYPEVCLEDDAGANFVPIGGGKYESDGDCSESSAVLFSGSFNGNGHSVSNIRLKLKTANIGFIRMGGTLKNISFINPSIEGTTNVGIASGSNATKLSGITITSGEVAGGTSVGGLAGEYSHSNTISNIQVKKTKIHLDNVTPYAKAGGLIGLLTSSPAKTIEYSSFEGMVKSQASSAYVGGLIGENNTAATVINDSFSSGVIIGSGKSYMGGFIGKISGGSLSVANSYSRMSFGPDSYSDVDGGKIGGMAGFGTVTPMRSYFYGSILHPCTSSEASCLVGGFSGSTASSGTNHYATFLNPNWNYTIQIGERISLTDFEVNRPQAALLTSGANWMDVGAVVPRLSWETGLCSQAVNNQSVANQVVNGRGGILNPVILCTKEQWKEIKDYSALNYRLEDNINLGDLAEADMPTNFSGSLDGNHFIISGAYINIPSTGGGLFKINSGKIYNTEFASFYLSMPTSAGAGAAYTGVVAVNTGTISNNSYEAVNLNGTSTNMGVVAGVNSNKILMVKVHSRLKSVGNSGFIVGVNNANGSIIGARAEGRMSLVGNPSAASGYGGIAGINYGTLREVETGATIINGSATGNSDVNSFVGSLVGVNSSLVFDALIRPEARLSIERVGPSYGQVFGKTTSTSAVLRVVALNEIAVPSSSGWLNDTKSFVHTSEAGADYTNSYILDRAVFEYNSAASIGSSISCTVPTSYQLGTLTTPSQDFLNGFYVSGVTLGDKTLTSRITGTLSSHIISPDSLFSIPCELLDGTTGVRQIRYSIPNFTDSEVQAKIPAFFSSLSNFCPSSASASAGETSTYQCQGNEYNMVSSKMGGIGFTRLVDAYKELKIDGNFPTVRPVWMISDDEHPHLFLTSQ